MSYRSTWPPRCEFCGKFISYKDLAKAIVYTPHGNCLDLDPPDPEFVHKKCWNKEEHQESKKLIIRVAWRPPYDQGKQKLC